MRYNIIIHKASKDYIHLVRKEEIHMNKELFDELEEAAKPLQDFLQKHFDMMTKVEVEIGHISVLRAEMGMPTEIND